MGDDLIRAQKETAKAIQRQTNFHKNACGCLLLILLAPLWVPAALALLVAIGISSGSSSSITPMQYDDSEGATPAQTSGSSFSVLPPAPSAPAPYSSKGQADDSDDVFTARYADNVYHKNASCSALEGKIAGGGISVQLRARGMTPCKICLPEPKTTPSASHALDDNAVVYLGGGHFHLNKGCSAIGEERPSVAMASKAKEKGFTPCSLCATSTEISNQ